MTLKSKNQEHPTPPKKKRTDVQGNDSVRIFAKSGTATIMLARGMTQNAAAVFLSNLRVSARNLGGECACDFIITKGK